MVKPPASNPAGFTLTKPRRGFLCRTDFRKAVDMGAADISIGWYCDEQDLTAPWAAPAIKSHRRH